MFIKPREGYLIPDPAMEGTPDRLLPPEGREVVESDYWTRRLRDRDVELASPPDDKDVKEAP